MLNWLLGRRLRTHEAEHQQIGVAHGIPVLGLDALSSAAYGPEAALTLLLPLGAAGLAWVAPISGLIVGLVLIVFFSYRQTITAYPGGGGSYTVAKQNLGTRAGLLAGAALALDYVLNVAVGISAGVGALVSALPSLQPHTLAICLILLVFLTVMNLRGVKESGIAFLVPTYLFIGSLFVVIIMGVVKTLLAGGHPIAVTAPPSLPRATAAASLWIVLRAFSSGCTAMTGIEAVSNGVPLFRKPEIAQRTLGAIVAILVVLLLGIAWLSHAYAIGATEPGQAGYQSLLSMLTAAVVGRGAFYYLTLGSVVAVLALSANTSFADFPRLCRVLAEDFYLPGMFAVRGRRLVFSHGIVVLAVFAGAILVAFGGITDRLIPLFAIGAFLAFTLSQAGMVVHFRKRGDWRSLAINSVGAAATGLTLVVVAVSKFAEGAWLTALVIPLLMLLFIHINRHYRKIARQIDTIDPLELPTTVSPIVVLAAGTWNKLTQHGLKFALRLSSDVHIVQIRTERDDIEELYENWKLLIASPAQAAGIREPKLVILTSDTRRFFTPFVDYVQELEINHPSRDIVVVIPDLVMTRWYSGLLHNNRGVFLRTLLRLRCDSRVAIIDLPYRLS
jgi:amino acid transporter